MEQNHLGEQHHDKLDPAARSVLTFWFSELDSKCWWQPSQRLDQNIKDRFGPLLAEARLNGLAHWRQTAQGRLAELIVLDQFSRNIHRGHPESFAADPLALTLAQDAVAQQADQQIVLERRPFIYLPFMHSEDPAVHEHAVELFGQPGLEFYLGFEEKHKVIIDRFGRYPHRNHILGRPSTPEEVAFLNEPDSSF